MKPHHWGWRHREPRLSRTSSSAPRYGWCSLLHPASAAAGWSSSCTPHTWRDLRTQQRMQLNHLLKPSLFEGIKKQNKQKQKTPTRGSVTFNGEVEASQPVSWQRISPTLENHCTGLVHLHDLSHYLHEEQRRSCSEKRQARFRILQRREVRLLTGLKMAS